MCVPSRKNEFSCEASVLPGGCPAKSGRGRKRFAFGTAEQREKTQKLYERSQYVIENTESELKNELKTNSKRSLFEREMNGLNTKIGGLRTRQEQAFQVSG